jgi:hypothetical protein
MWRDIKMMPLRCYAIFSFSFLWFLISVRQWAIDYYNLSNLLFAMGFFLLGLYVAYDQWIKSLKEKEMEDIKKDIQAIDEKLNRLEIYLIENKK